MTTIMMTKAEHRTDAIIIGAGSCCLFAVFELGLLGECKPNSPLACQVLMSEELDGLTVKLAPNSAP